MGDTLTGVRTVRPSWWQRLTARLKPSPRPAWHAPRPASARPRDNRPGGKHRRSDGGAHDHYQLPDGRWITFTRP
jgi:hypothetical protein